MYPVINNNFDMIRNMKNLFDYEEYVSLCKEKEITIRSLHQYCMAIGTLMVARSKYPVISWQEAYIKTFQEMNKALPPNYEEGKTHEGCNGCGNKKEVA